MPTGITQNVEDILSCEYARSIISNSDFVLMLKQAQLDRRELANMFDLSETEVDYITEKDCGVGLMYTGKTVIPFEDKFPTNTKLFKAMTTKKEEDSKIDRILNLNPKASPKEMKEKEEYDKEQEELVKNNQRKDQKGD